MLLGPPLSGKSSQCQALATRLGLPHIQVGALLQARAAAGDEALQTILQASIFTCMVNQTLAVTQLETSSCTLMLSCKLWQQN